MLGSLLDLLEDLTRSHTPIATHPIHVLRSEVYIVALLADCCSSSWSAISDSLARASAAGFPTPEPLDEGLVNRVFDVAKQLLEPIPDNYVLPAEALLEQISDRNIRVPRPSNASQQKSDASAPDVPCLEDCLVELDVHIKTVVEYVSASSWSTSFAYFRHVVYSIRTTSFADASSELSSSSQAAEKLALVIVRLVSFFWVDASKLGHVIQELCSSYLHFRRSCQNTVAVALPLLITRWIDRFPDQFMRLHLIHKRLDGGADTLFDMTQTVVDNGKKKAVFYPLQMTLLLLLPDVFQVASNMREAKSNSVVKKVAFLDSLRKALRNGNERAAYCLVTLLRAARHFDAENDSALVSYAMDVQDEVRDALFGSPPALPPVLGFDQDIITGAFASLAHLNLNGSIDALLRTCISQTSPEKFKIAVVQTCSYFAGQAHAIKCDGLFNAAIPFMRAQFEVCCWPIIIDKSMLTSSRLTAAVSRQYRGTNKGQVAAFWCNPSSNFWTRSQGLFSMSCRAPLRRAASLGPSSCVCCRQTRQCGSWLLKSRNESLRTPASCTACPKAPLAQAWRNCGLCCGSRGKSIQP